MKIFIVEEGTARDLEKSVRETLKEWDTYEVKLQYQLSSNEDGFLFTCMVIVEENFV